MTYLRLTASLVVALAASTAFAQPCTTSWTNASGGAWSDGANWDNGVPTAASVACITLDGTYAVTVGGFSVDVLRLGGASGTQTLTNTNNLSAATAMEVGANGDFEWASGYYTGGPLTNEGLIRLTTGTGSRGVNGPTFRNEGSVEHASSGIFYVYNGGRVENAGTWDVTGSGDITGSTGAGTFVNETGALLLKSGAGSTVFSGGGLVVENMGTMEATAGDLRFDRPSTHTDATLTTGADGTIQFAAGGVTFSGTIVGVQAGTLTVDDGITASPATWAFTGTGMDWTDAYLEAGTLTNTGVVQLAGGSASRGARGATAVFRNEATVVHSSSGVFYVYNGARVENAATWEVSGAGDLLGSTGVGTFVNEAGATLLKSGAGITSISGGGLVVENAGTVEATAGDLQFDRPSTHTDATLAAGAGGTIRFASGGVTFSGTIDGAQAGTLTVDDGITASPATWAFSGDGVEWTSEYLEAGTLTNTGVVRLTGGSGSRGVRGATSVFRNEATVEQSSSGAFYVYNAARVENAATWEVSGAGDLLGFSGAGTFANEVGAVLLKSGAGITEISGGGLVVENAGTVEATAGVLQFDRPSTHTDATLATGADGTIQFAVGGVTFSGTIVGVQAGTLTVDDAITSTAGIWSFTGTGMEWTSEYLESGTLTNTGVVRLTGGSGSRGVRGATAVFRNRGMLEHSSSGPFYVYNDARVENRGSWEITDSADLLGFTGAGTFVNERGGLLTTSGAGITAISGGGLVVENAGRLVVADGTLDVNRPFELTPTGVLDGVGTFDVTGSSPFVQDGHTVPGVGTPLDWEDDWSPSPGSIFGVRLGGPTAGTEHSQLAVGGTGTVDGRLRVVLTDGFVPTVGQTFTVVTCGTACAGAFTDIVPPLGVTFEAEVLANAVEITATAVGFTLVRIDPDDPVVIGPEGGSVPVRYALVNAGSTPVSSQTWTTLTLPSEETVEVQQPKPLELAAETTVRRRTLVVLADDAPPGDYTLTRYVGTPGGTILATDAYDFSKDALAERATAPVALAAAASADVADGPTVTVTAAGVRTDDVPEGLDDPVAEAPTETRLRAPFPNPTARRATIAYELAAPAAVRLIVFDALGREVARLADGPAEAGRYEAPVDASRLPSGTYLVRLQADGVVATRRFTVVR